MKIRYGTRWLETEVITLGPGRAEIRIGPVDDATEFSAVGVLYSAR